MCRSSASWILVSKKSANLWCYCLLLFYSTWTEQRGNEFCYSPKKNYCWKRNKQFLGIGNIGFILLISYEMRKGCLAIWFRSCVLIYLIYLPVYSMPVRSVINLATSIQLFRFKVLVSLYPGWHLSHRQRLELTQFIKHSCQAILLIDADVTRTNNK